MNKYIKHQISELKKEAKEMRSLLEQYNSARNNPSWPDWKERERRNLQNELRENERKQEQLKAEL